MPINSPGRNPRSAREDLLEQVAQRDEEIARQVLLKAPKKPNQTIPNTSSGSKETNKIEQKPTTSTENIAKSTEESASTNMDKSNNLLDLSKKPATEKPSASNKKEAEPAKKGFFDMFKKSETPEPEIDKKIDPAPKKGIFDLFKKPETPEPEIEKKSDSASKTKPDQKAEQTTTTAKVNLEKPVVEPAPAPMPTPEPAKKGFFDLFKKPEPEPTIDAELPKTEEPKKGFFDLFKKTETPSSDTPPSKEEVVESQKETKSKGFFDLFKKDEPDQAKANTEVPDIVVEPSSSVAKEDPAKQIDKEKDEYKKKINEILDKKERDREQMKMKEGPPTARNSPGYRTEEENLRSIWKELGVGKNGLLSKEELRRVCEHIGIDDMSDEELNTLYKKLDPYNEGGVSFDGFLTGLYRKTSDFRNPGRQLSGRNAAALRSGLGKPIGLMDGFERTQLPGSSVSSGLFSALNLDGSG
ncbi:hypothetical protein Ciccas_008843 [Cichlidogyrus casuarinus]|uniref:EF-hand domain-containing protein n=1 Tax=Cichlidogyrus casuarinus TaxID=1844966 RepID=A0ABD2Q0E7_9PLAT